MNSHTRRHLNAQSSSDLQLPSCPMQEVFFYLSKCEERHYYQWYGFVSGPTENEVDDNAAIVWNSIMIRMKSGFSVWFARNGFTTSAFKFEKAVLITFLSQKSIV